jgi:glycosyltransferase involved in cell wall biosynthesis
MEMLLADLSDFTVSYLPVSGNPSTFTFFRSVFHTILSNHYNLIHSQGLTAALCALLPTRLTGTPHLATFHDIFNKGQFKGSMGFLKRSALFLLAPLINKIHAVTFDAKDNLLEYVPSLRASRKKIVTIRHGIEAERFLQAGVRDFRQELNLPREAFLIGFLGRFMSPKGFTYLTDAIDLLVRSCRPSLRPYVLTFGDGAFIREEQAYIKSKGLEEYFCFMPFSPDIAPSLKGLDVVAMPSLWEACGLLAMETMVAGVPLIATDCVGLREVLRNTPATMVGVRNSESLAQALLSELQEPSKIRARAFQAEAAVRFNVSRSAGQLEHVMDNLCRPGPRNEIPAGEMPCVE